MLYDKRWDEKVKTDFRKLPSLVVWLETQPADKSYVYDCVGGCLLAQYLIAEGFREPAIGNILWSAEGLKTEDIPRNFFAVAHGQPRTFGAALERARALLP